MSRLSMLFARRYLLSRKSLSVINIISRVSIFAVGVPVAAMVILMSVFNGFDSLVKSMYTSFDPDILVSPAQGKVFVTESFEERGLGNIEGVEEYSYVLEDKVLLEYRGRQTFATLRGVDDYYDMVVPIRELVVAGDYELTAGDLDQAVVGQGLAYEIGVRTSFYNPINVYSPKRGQFSSLLPIDSYNTGRIFPGGVFALDMETDGTYIIGSMDFASKLLDYQGKASAVMVKLTRGMNPEKARREISSLLGDDYRVQTRYEQKASMYSIMKYEKWGIFFITLLVLVIASFSIVGSLVMLIIDKRPDIGMIMAMGGNVRFARRIFTDEGMLIGMIGTAGGVVLGAALCMLQQRFGFIKLGGQSFLVDSYPVMMQWQDIVVIIAATLAVNWIIAKFTVSKMIPDSTLRL